MSTAVVLNPGRTRLGELLIERELLTTAQLEAALEEHRESQTMLGEVLLRRDLISRRQLLMAVADQMAVELVDFDDIVVDEAAAELVSQNVAQRLRALPIGWDGNRLRVAMANPRDVFALDDLRTLTSQKITAVLADSEQLDATIARIWKAREAEQATAVLTSNGSDGFSTGASVTDGPVAQLVDQILTRAIKEKASDIHVEPDGECLRVRFRLDGMLHNVLDIPAEIRAGVIGRLKIMGQVDISERRIPQDGRISLELQGHPVDVRMVTVPTAEGEAIVLRVLDRDTNISSLDELGFLPQSLERFRSAVHKPWGAILVTGPTGSGKTTTLYAALAELHRPELNIVTVEDPVEYRVRGIKQMQVHRRAGLTFASALRSVLRADPDVILVGEIRDGETANMAAEAALTGHLVLSTLHTNDACSTPLRLTEMGVEPYLVTSALSCVVAQRLVRKLCDECKRPAEVIEGGDLAKRLAAIDGLTNFSAPTGCSACNNTGYRGRIPIHEVLNMTEDVGKLIIGGTSSVNIKALAIEQGMTTLFEDGMHKCAAGLTSLDEVLRVVG